MLPDFDEHGLLPSGDYPLTFAEVRESLLVVGPGADHPNWDAGWRVRLVDNLEILVGQLWATGKTEIFVDGSFVEDKAHPNDIDGYFVCELDELASGVLGRQLNLLDPYKVWTWDPASQRPFRGYPKRQLPMWHRYRVELYPHYGQTVGHSRSVRERARVPLGVPALSARRASSWHSEDREVSDDPKRGRVSGGGEAARSGAGAPQGGDGAARGERVDAQ